MFQMIKQVLGRSMSRRGREKKTSRRVRLQVEGLEERQVLSHFMEAGELVHDESLVSSTSLISGVAEPVGFPLDLTRVAKQFPPHSGATTLFLNFDGASKVAAFVSTTGNRNADIQEILYRTSELFAPFNVQVRRISGVSNYSKVNGNTTIFIGDNSNVANTGGYTPWKHTDAPIQARAEDHQPNSDPWNYAFVDPIHNGDSTKNYDNLRIAKVAAHEAGHTFGLLHTRTVGQDPDSLSSSSANPPEVMAYDSSSAYEHFQNANYWITIYNRSSSGGTYLEEDLKAFWHDEPILLQNSYTYLQAVVGARPADDAANVVHRDYTNGRALVDASYTDSPLATVGPGTSLYDVINRQGDYDVYQLGAPTGVNYSLSIVASPTKVPYVDTVLMVYDNLDGRLVAFNSSASSLASKIIFRREQGHTYMVVVGGNNGNSAGMFRLSIANVIPAPQHLGSLSDATTTKTTTTTTTTSTTRTLSGSLAGVGADEEDGASIQAAALLTRQGGFHAFAAAPAKAGKLRLAARLTDRLFALQAREKSHERLDLHLACTQADFWAGLDADALGLLASTRFQPVAAKRQ